MLNAGFLPNGYFAMLEAKAVKPVPDLVVMDLEPSCSADDGGIDVSFQPPGTRFVVRTESAAYAKRANRVAVRHPEGNVVAVIEIVSPGNKDSRHAIEDFARKAVAFLDAGVHLLIADLSPPVGAIRRGFTRLYGTSLVKRRSSCRPTSR